MKDVPSKENQGLILNIAILGVSMVVIAMVTIAIVTNLNGSEQSVTTVRTLQSVCQETEEQESCFHLLKHVGEKATVLDYFKGAINTTITELLVVSRPKPHLERSLTPLQQHSYRYCLELLSLGMEELENMHIIANSYDALCKIDPDDMINSLSAVISYQHTCSDELMRTNSYHVLGYSLTVPVLLTRITLSIVNTVYERTRSRATQQQWRQEQYYRAWHTTMESKTMGSQGEGGKQQPINVVVAQDGSGHFTTIAESLNACPKNNTGPCVIHVKEGIYEERVVIPKDVLQLFMYGDGPLKTIVCGNNTRNHQTTSFQAATFVVMGKGFIGKDMGFIAPADIVGAPALLVLSDHAAFFNCKIDGEEGSLFAVAQRQFYRDCEILGSADIIKGDSATVIQNSKIMVKGRNSSRSGFGEKVVSAQSRFDRSQRTGLVIQNCTITAYQESNNNPSLTATTYLGTPYGEYSTTIIMESFLGDVIHQKGWCKWSDNYGIGTATFREYNNRGPGAITDTRVGWSGCRKRIEKNQMVSYIAAQFIQVDQWFQNAAIPYESGFVFEE
ncbi:hypothetical protein RJT34_19205 [Clitoria ternatea]|uniref:pectinesterase n=1 Tax=Clitoria ternatea TaxID=43366 RepID=A0AAN9IQT1_CLITE